MELESCCHFSINKCHKLDSKVNHDNTLHLEANEEKNLRTRNSQAVLFQLATASQVSKLPPQHNIIVKGSIQDDGNPST